MSGIEPITTHYTVFTKVLRVEERFRNEHKFGGGIATKTSLGWFVTFEGSYESLYFGETEPDFRAGEKIKITFERVHDAKPS